MWSLLLPKADTRGPILKKAQTMTPSQKQEVWARAQVNTGNGTTGDATAASGSAGTNADVADPPQPDWLA